MRAVLESPNTNSLQEKGYQISIALYDKGVFNNLAKPAPQDLFKKDEIEGLYQLHFSEFLTIRHLHLLQSTQATKVAISGAEQQKFGSDRTQSISQKKKASISRLYKISRYLLFDVNGNIINKSDVREYDFWANQRLATTLPIDYKTFTDKPLNLEKVKTPVVGIDTLHILKQLVGFDDEQRDIALKTIQSNWSDAFVAPLLDILRLSNDGWLQKELKQLLIKQIPKLTPKYFEGIQWLWNKEEIKSDFYADWKGYLYSSLDPSFHNYFHGRSNQVKIRMDEIVWGGVVQDGIPPLRSPKMLSATDASLFG